MKVVGAHIRISKGRYLAGFALVEGTDFSRPLSLPAPPDGDEGRQLEELFRATLDLLADVQPELLAVRVSEAGDKKAQRAEGAIMAAAGASNVPVRLWVGAGLLKPSGLTRGSFAERAAALCKQVSDAPIRPKEIEQAAAAARASVVENGE